MKLLRLFRLTFLPVAATVTADETPFPADDFVESLSVCTHWGYTDTVYHRNYTGVQNKLAELGIRYCRDGLSQQTETRAVDLFTRYGIRHSVLISDVKNGALTNENIDSDLDSCRTLHTAGALWAIEGPNEYDSSERPNWVNELRTYQQALFDAVNADTNLKDYPVLGPSMAHANDSTYPQLGDMTGMCDIGNMHPYPGARRAEANINWWISKARTAHGDQPLMATETGYQTALNDPRRIPVTEDIQAIYLPRVLMKFYERGLVKTSKYELIDLQDNPEKDFFKHNWGLLRNDLSEKPVYKSVKNLISLLADPGSNFTVTPLSYDLSGDLSGVENVLFQKRNGEYYLVIWQTARSWDQEDLVPITVPERTLTLTPHIPMSSISVYCPSPAPIGNGTSAMQSWTNPDSVKLDVPDQLMVVKMTPRIDTSKTFRFNNVKSGMALMIKGGGTSDNDPVVQRPDQAWVTQRWYFRYLTDGYYAIYNQKSDKSMCVYGAGLDNDDPIVQQSFQNWQTQRWRVRNEGGGSIRLTCEKSDKVIMIKNGSNVDKAPAVQKTWNNWVTQRWYLIIE